MGCKHGELHSSIDDQDVLFIEGRCVTARSASYDSAAVSLRHCACALPGANSRLSRPIAAGGKLLQPRVAACATQPCSIYGTACRLGCACATHADHAREGRSMLLPVLQKRVESDHTGERRAWARSRPPARLVRREPTAASFIPLWCSLCASTHSLPCLPTGPTTPRRCRAAS